MKFLPMNFHVEGKVIVIIGGGRVATQKLRTLVLTPARILVFAVTVCDGIRAMPVTWEETAYDKRQLDGALLVYASTDDRSINRTIAVDARAKGIPVNVADDPANSDFISPALWMHNKMTVAVSSDGADPKRSVAWRNAIKEWGERDSALR